MDDPALSSSETNAFGGKTTPKSQSSSAFGNTVSGEKVTTPTNKNVSTTLSGNSIVETDSNGNYIIKKIQYNNVIVNNNLNDDNEGTFELKEIKTTDTRGTKNKTANLSSGDETELVKSGQTYNHIKQSIDSSLNILSETKGVHLKKVDNKIKISNVDNYETLMDITRGFYSKF